MPRKITASKVKRKKRKYGVKSNYTPEALEEALNNIRSGAMSRLEAAKYYQIPHITLFNKINKSLSKPCECDEPLINEEEKRSEAPQKIVTSKIKTNKRKYGIKSNYSPEALEEALDKIRSGAMSRLEASHHYKIPKVTLFYKMNDSHSKPWGKPITFNKEEEQRFTTHLLHLSNLDIPLCLLDIRLTVKHYLDSNKIVVRHFNDNLPGYQWASRFVRRNSQLKDKIIHNLITKRKRVTQEQVQYFFNKIATEIEEVPPTEIYNMDELGFCDNLEEKQIVFHRHSRYPDLIKKPVHSCYTVVFCANANGDILPPFFIFKGTVSPSRCKLTKDWLSQAPPGSKMAVSKSGWIDTLIFEEWFEKHFIPHVIKQKGQKVLFCDTFSAHISPKTLRLGKENNISFICFLPNSSSLLQPLSSGYFLALESAWRRVIYNYEQLIEGSLIQNLSRPLFAHLIYKALQHISDVSSDTVITGFQKCGLYPFSPSTVLSKLPAYMSQNVVSKLLSKSYKALIKRLRSEHFYANVETPYSKSIAEQIETIKDEGIIKEEIEFNDNEEENYLDIGYYTNNTSTKKRGRPFGSKNKKKFTLDLQDNMMDDIIGKKYIKTEKVTEFRFKNEVKSEDESDIIEEYLDIDTSDEDSIIFIVDREAW